ncbi:MAG: hypothetical protein ACLGJB_08560 [Blastocatellia bacterium]
MIDILHRSTAKLSITLLLIVSSISAVAPSAAAFETPATRGKEDARDARSPEATAAPSISYVLYKEASTRRPEMEIPAAHPQFRGFLNQAANLSAANASNVSAVAGKRVSTMPLPTGAPAVSTAPMTPGEKFHFWAKRFKSPGSYGAAIASGLWNELLDNDEGKEDTLGNYFADAATRAARSYAFGTTAGFFEKFAYASLFRQDPRYHRSDKRGAGAKVSYAVSRVFITQGDRCGCDQFNISFLAGGLTAAGISNVWEREERQTVGKTFQRWGTHIAITAMTNILREFIGGQ